MVLANGTTARTIYTKLASFLSFNCILIRCQSTISQWYASEVTTDRKSKFQARHVPITDEQDIPAILEKLLAEHKNISRSSHPHIIAWRTGQVVSTPTITLHTKSKKRKDPPMEKNHEIETKYHNVSQGFKDNGEKEGGTKLLQQVLVRHSLMNILVIVTRWYGGTPIGSLRFRHIINASIDSLRKSNTL